MQELVAGVLRAMGYKTRVSPAGPDGEGTLSPLPMVLDFQPPRIVVEVKHRKAQWALLKFEASSVVFDRMTTVFM